MPLAASTSHRRSSSLFPALSTLAFLLALCPLAEAQANRVMGPVDRTDPAKRRFEEDSRREMELRNMGRPSSDATKDPKRRQALAAEVELDFERILTLHNQLAHAIKTGDTLDFDFVAGAAVDIKKHAAHLQTALTLPRPETTERDTAAEAVFNDGQFKDAVIIFCKRIESFVRNPVIENPGTVDPLQTARARRDLDNVVQFSDRLRKMAERLKKPSK